MTSFDPRKSLQNSSEPPSLLTAPDKDIPVPDEVIRLLADILTVRALSGSHVGQRPFRRAGMTRKVKRGDQNSSGGDVFDEMGVTAAELIWTMFTACSAYSFLVAMLIGRLIDWSVATLTGIVTNAVTLVVYARYKAWKQARRQR